MQVPFDLSVLLFVAGALTGALRPSLRFSDLLSKLLSRYLLIAIGLKGGAALAGSDL